MAGLREFIEYIQGLKFLKSDIEYLRSKKLFSEEFLKYLETFKFTCDVWAIPEGTPVFPYEPLVTVKGPIIEVQLIETMLLLCINHQSLISTKANRMVRAAEGRKLMEFGSRRSHGFDAAFYGARAAFIGGFMGTSCTIADKELGIPALGTMAHSWIQFYPTELDAFRAYARTYPQSCTLLVDTYNVLKSGVPNAIKVFQEEVVPRGFRPKGIRLDSGDLAYLSIEARKMLDEAGFPDCAIIASNSLDEYVIRDLLIQGAKIDLFGVGERLVTAKSEPVFGGVYKLVQVERNGQIIPKIKISENVEKVTNPGHKKVYRLFDNETGKAIADVITLVDEVIDEKQPYELFDPVYTWKKKIVTNYTAKPLQEKIFDNGNLACETKDIMDIRQYCIHQIETLWPDLLRFENPGKYYVNLSLPLWKLKNDLLQTMSK